MTVITLPKNFDDIETPTLLEDDYYQMRLVKAPEVLPNAVLKAFAKERGIKDFQAALASALAEDYTSDEGKYPGFNLVLSLRTVHDDPMINGRAFKRYLSLPNDGDRKRVIGTGQTSEDFKMSQLMAELSAFLGGPPSGNEVELEPGMMAEYYVTTQASLRDPNRLENTIDMNSVPQAV